MPQQLIIKLLTALLEYLNFLFYNFLVAEALLSPQNASIIPDSHTYLLCSKLY